MALTDSPNWRRHSPGTGRQEDETAAQGRRWSSPIVFPADVGGPVAWQELVRRGAVVVVVEDAAVPRDAIVDERTRAAAISGRVPRGSTLAGLGAAWVLAGGTFPDALETIHAPGRHRPMPTRQLRPRQARLLHDESLDLAGLRVTGPLRTALDVATFAPTQQATSALVLLLTQCDLSLAAALQALELRYRWPRRDRARSILEAARSALPP